MKGNFKPIKIINDIDEKNLPVLLVTNHNSWWDGFWVQYINIQIFKRKFHFMMIEEQLRKFWFFNYTGGFSVRKNSKSIIETLDYTRQLLTNKNNLVLMYPQGEIQSMHEPVFKFERGLEHILKKMENPVQVVFMVSLVDYFSNPKPGLFLYLTEYKGTDFKTETIQMEFSGFYSDCVAKQKLEAK
jgi:1-acyl-sn-glycerol-3-phosphate acyltransferase